MARALHVRAARFVLLGCLALLASSALGCELVADFDRAKIPAKDAGSGGNGGGLPDGSLIVPTGDAATTTPDAGPTVLDAAAPAPDASDVAPPALDAGPDAGLDAG